MKNYYFRWCVFALLNTALFLTGTNAYAQLAKCKGKYFGNIIQGSVRSNYNTFWNQTTSENGSKWGSVEGTKGVYNFSTSDVAYNWAKNNNGLFKYHTFVWGSQTPGWVSSASTATLTRAIEDYIKACSTHYTPMGGLKLIDVLNEPVNTPMPGNMKAALTAGYQAEPANANDKNNPYGWVIWSFQLARKYFPDATLLINEYNVEMNWNNCRAPYIAMTNAVKNAPNLTDGRKNLIDGVGLQCHGVDNLTAANFKACIDEIWTKTGLPIHITEFDQTANPNEAKQQSVYSTLIPVAWEHPRVAGITLWGYIQGTTWINGNGASGPGGTDSGIIYNSNYGANPNGDRPAMTWLKSYLASRPSLSCCPAPAPFASCSTNNPPTVSITAPANNASFTAPATISITATASDADGTISSVQFYNGTTLLGTDVTAPYSFSWSNVATGTYSITAKATDNAGAVTTSTAVSVVVSAPNIPPTVSITAPANNANFTAPATINITATASDADGTISSVQFYNGTSLLGTDVTAPYSFSWTNVAAGTYSITVKATDNAGAVTTSTAVVIVVTGVSVNNPPTVSITAPANNASFTAPATINITATASDADGVVRSVDFYNGTTLLGSDSVSPYSFSWTNVAIGTYSITARATDDSGAVAVSSARTIVVVAPNTPPAISITAPANNASFTAPATISITATASDADGTISSVQFYNGTTLLGTDVTAPYSFSWSNVAAGTYSITARATDNLGAVTTSAPVSVVVTPVVSTADIIGPDCGSNNVTLSFSLNPAHRANVTSYNWWYGGSAARTTMVAGSPYSVTVQTGPYFSAGQVCVGTNLSVAPWYKQFCKPVAKCSATRNAADDLSAEYTNGTTVVPNPTSDVFSITAAEDVSKLSVVNEMGYEVYSANDLGKGQNILVGDQFTAGIYTVKIYYKNGANEVKRLVKIN